jgi:hypothetical protein
MRNLSVLFAAACLFATAAIAATPPEPATAGWERGQTYDRQYDPNLEVVVPASVLQVEKFTPSDGMAEGVRVQVKSRGETLWVHLAPAAWLAAQKFEVGKGDLITVTGSYLKMDGERVIMAAKVERDGKTLRLRDDSGKPAWTAWHPRPA